MDEDAMYDEWTNTPKEKLEEFHDMENWPPYTEEEKEVTYWLEGPAKERLEMIQAISDAMFCLNTWTHPEATSQDDLEKYLNEDYLARTKTMLVHFRRKLREL